MWRECKEAFGERLRTVLVPSNEDTEKSNVTSLMDKVMGHSNMLRCRIVLDLSDDPIREMLLVAVLSEMVGSATAEVQDVSLDSEQDLTTSDPEHGSKQAEVASHL
jgi:hypothetical protein